MSAVSVLFRAWAAALAACIACTGVAHAGQVEIAGPAGSVFFGARVAVLPNGNLVITDPAHADGGAAYLYSRDGQMISKLTGRPPGATGPKSTNFAYIEILVLANGNYVLVCPEWPTNGMLNVGYVAWGSAVTGVSGSVSTANALVGTFAENRLGNVIPLANGNYLVGSVLPLAGSGELRASVTWANGYTGLAGTVSAANSVVASSQESSMGSRGFMIPLTNGHYVVRDGKYIRWLDGTGPSTGPSTDDNSLFSNSVGDETLRSVTALTNGNYVVSSPDWDNGLVADVGAVTWADGAKPTSGPISSANSLVGSSPGNFVGYPGAIALPNGNYVAVSADWDLGGGPSNVGAVTWGNGAKGTVGIVSTSNSITGSSTNDYVGQNPYASGVFILSNGNYVVSSTLWDNGQTANAGAVRWGDGWGPTTGPISHANALYGIEAEARIGRGGIRSLGNGNYVLVNTDWPAGIGSATWADGERGSTGPVNVANSITAEKDGDGMDAIPLSDGNWLASSGMGRMGAVMWVDGSKSSSDVVLRFNSVTGSQFWDFVSGWPLSDGSYLAGSPSWDAGTLDAAGGFRWLRGGKRESGLVSVDNALVGSTAMDRIGQGDFKRLARGLYLMSSPYWSSDTYYGAGAVTLGRRGSLVGPVSATNSVVGVLPLPGGFQPETSALYYDYDAARERLVVGRPIRNTVSVFVIDNDLIFTDGFETIPRTCEWRDLDCREPTLGTTRW